MRTLCLITVKEEEKNLEKIPTRREFPSRGRGRHTLCLASCVRVNLTYTSAVMRVGRRGALSLKCTLPGNALVQHRASLSLSLPFYPPRNPGYTLAATAARSTLRVQGGANLQRVGVSRGATKRGVIA